MKGVADSLKGKNTKHNPSLYRSAYIDLVPSQLNHPPRISKRRVWQGLAKEYQVARPSISTGGTSQDDIEMHDNTLYSLQVQVHTL